MSGAALPVPSDAIQAALGAARERWPAVSLEGAELEAFVREKAAGAEGTALRIDELALAFACAQHDAEALRVFERDYLPGVDVALARAGVPSGDRDDARARLRERLLFGAAGARPKLLEFSGRGELKAWLKVAAARIGLRSLRDQREEPSEDPLAAEVRAPIDAEREFLKGKYREEFQGAFREALSALEERQRDLLRRHYLESETTEALALELEVDRATAVRWLAKARQALLEATRARLAERLRLKGTREFASVLRLVRSQLRVSLSQFLPKR